MKLLCALHGALGAQSQKDGTGAYRRIFVDLNPLLLLLLLLLVLPLLLALTPKAVFVRLWEVYSVA